MNVYKYNIFDDLYLCVDESLSIFIFDDFYLCFDQTLSIIIFDDLYLCFNDQRFVPTDATPCSMIQ